MKHGEPVRVVLERRSEFTAGDDHEQAKKTAVQKTSNLLFAWRSRLTEEALQAPREYSDVTINSPHPDYVDVVVTGPEKLTRYSFNGATGDVLMQVLPVHEDIPVTNEPLPSDLIIHERLSRVLFDCDRIEMRG